MIPLREHAAGFVYNGRTDIYALEENRAGPPTGTKRFGEPGGRQNVRPTQKGARKGRSTGFGALVLLAEDNPLRRGTIRASDGRVEPDHAGSVRPERKRAERVSQTTHSERPPKNVTHRRRHDGIFRCTHEKTANRRTTVACSPHESPDDRSGNNGNTIRNIRHGRSADRKIRPRRRISTEKREAAQSGDLPSGSYSVPTPKDIPASCSFFIPAKTVPRRGRFCRLPHFSGHRGGFFAARRTVGPASFRPSGSSETPSAVRPPDVPARRFRTNRRF